MITGRFTARFPVHGLDSVKHLKRAAVVQLAGMIDGYDITGPWDFTFTTGRDGQRYLVATAPAVTTLPREVVEARREAFEAALTDTPQMLPFVRRAA